MTNVLSYIILTPPYFVVITKTTANLFVLFGWECYNVESICIKET